MAARTDSTSPDATAADNTALRVAVGTRVRQERERRGLTKEALGELAGLQSRYIWRVEDGRQNTTVATLAAIAGAFGITLAELLANVEGLVADPVEWPTVKPRGPKARSKPNV